MNTLNRKTYYGKYRGVVTDNLDPMGKGRIKARVPDVKGDGECSWALPCVPYAGDQVGWFMLPPVNALVWIEFENGHWDHPIWSGCFWDDSQAPASPAVPEMKVLQTDTATITIDDTDGASSVSIETQDGMKITMDSTGITLDNGQGSTTEPSGPSVKVNDDGLQVM
jgi:uncharacterized protein involved in type VI secretion and phage assembly